MKHAVILIILLSVTSALAQPPMPKPGPENKKLEYFVGNWTSEGEMKPSPMGPGGKVSMKEDSTLMEGGFFVVIRSTFTSAAMGNGGGLSIMGYDPAEKIYTYSEFNSWGEANHSKGTVDGDTWTWLSDVKAGPKTMKGRFTMKIVSPTEYSYRFEMSPDGTKWDLYMEGKATKDK